MNDLSTQALQSASSAEIHPRPQFRRAVWQDLCGEWGFAFDDDDRGLTERWYDGAAQFGRKITVPYPPEAELSGVGDTGFHPVVWYRREFTVADELRGAGLRLHFGAVDY